MFAKHGTLFRMLLRGFWVVACPWILLTMGADAATVDVRVRGNFFAPATVNVRPGDTVRWIWDDPGHSVTSGRSCTSDGRFNSGVKSSGTFTRTFTQLGQVPYFCIPHCSAGMTGTVNVVPPPKLMLKIDTMFGVASPFIQAGNAIRGVASDELPWRVASLTGQLFDNGRLIVNVRGLVHPNSPAVPPALRGRNDSATFRGLVSCLTTSGGRVVQRNLMTRGFSATTSGNSNINTSVTLPRPCVAPIVMVIAGSENKWFAVTGR